MPNTDFHTEFSNWVASRGHFTIGTDGFRNDPPDETPDNCVWSVEETAPENNRYLPVEYRRISFWSRNKSSPAARQKLEDIGRDLHRFANFETTTYHIYLVHTVVPVIPLDRDHRRRPLYSFTVQVICWNKNSLS